MSSTNRRIERCDRLPAGTEAASDRAGVVGRIGGWISGPMLVVLGLVAAAMAVPILGPPPDAGDRIEPAGGAMVVDLAFSPGGDRIYSDHQGIGPMILGVDERGLYRGPSAEELSSLRLAVDPSGRSVVVALSDNTLQVLDPETLEVRDTLIGHESPVMDLRISGDGETLVSIDSDGLARIWTIAEARLDREFRGPTRLSSCALAPDGSRMALGGQDGSITVVDVSTGQELARWDGHGAGGAVVDLRFSPDGRTLISLGLDRCLRLWDTREQPVLVRAISFPGGMSPSLAVSPDGRTLATGHLDGQLRLWDARTGEQIGERPLDPAGVSSLCYAPDGRRLAVASGSVVMLIDLAEWA